MTAASAPLGPAARQGNTAFATSVALLVLRLALGWTFIYHGAQLAFGAFGGPGPENFSKATAYPVLPAIVWAYMAAYGQFLGGVSIFVGVLARLGALDIIVIMMVAIASVHAPHGFSVQNGGYEYNFNLIAASLAILIA